jgi:signal transduction histidine kinase
MTPRWSISLRLTAWFGGIFFVGWLLFGAAMWLNLKSTLTGERYQTLARRLVRLEDLLAKNQSESPADRAADFADFARATGNGLCEVFLPSGGRAFPSPTPAAQDFPWPALDTIGSERFQLVHWSGQAYWVLAHSYSLGSQPLYLLAAAPESGNQLVLDRFLTGLLASIPVLLVISSAGGYFLSRRALIPVDRITASARTISITNLSERVPVVRTGDELQRLAETCNAMLERLETAVNQIKQFTADASHDLRGPISFTRTVAEVALRNPGADPQSRQAFTDIVDESAKAAELLENLLTLARADADRGDAVLTPVNLAAVVEEACEMARPIAGERRHTFSMTLGAERLVSVLGDPGNLRRLLWILLDNALKYTPSPGRIDVSLATSTREATVTVRDNGIGIPESALPRIFDRFYRADPSRSQVEGSGLGLSIAKWIADTHRARLSVASIEHAGTTVCVAFPLHAE